MREKQIDLRFLLNVYDAFLREQDINKVAEALGLNGDTGQFHKWLSRNRDLQLVKSLADERRSKRNTLPAYILGNLSPKAKRIWAQITFWLENDQHTTGTPAMMNKVSTAIRQEIFLQALLHCSYNISKACQLAGINRQTMAVWQQEGRFAAIMDEISQHKKDFFENALMDLVENTHPGAIMFVNKTINADRGYSETLNVNHTVTAHLDVDSLDLDLDTRRKILEAIRKKRRDKDNVVDVEEVKALPAPNEDEDED